MRLPPEDADAHAWGSTDAVTDPWALFCDTSDADATEREAVANGTDWGVQREEP